MNEADTRARLIDPKLKQAGWGDSQITREHYYQRDHQYTQGRVILVGDRVRRGKVCKADYLLRYTDGFSIAVVEAKSDEEPTEAGLEQAKGYAKELGLAFAYATNAGERGRGGKRGREPFLSEPYRCTLKWGRAF